MTKASSNTLAGKIFLASALIILATLTVTGLNGYLQSRRAISSEVSSHVFGVLSNRRAGLEAWLEERRRDIHSHISRPEFTADVAGLIEGSGNAKETVHMRLKLQMDGYRSVYDEYLYCGLLTEGGSILVDSGTYVDRVPLRELAAFLGAQNGIYSVGPIHLSRDGETILNIATPIHDPDGELLAIYLCQMLTANTLQPILSDTTGLGWSGETFLVGADTVMLTPSRFHHHPEPLTHKMPIPAVLMALRGKTGVTVYPGYLGQEVVGAFTLMPGQDWVLVTEMVTEEAYAPLKAVARNTILVALAALVLLLLLAVSLSRTWTKPIERLADASVKVAAEDLTVRVPDEDRPDEIGTLARQFNRMVEAIQGSRETLKRSHAQLVQAEKLAAIGELSAGVVHEMRNPLSVIKLNLKLLKRKPDHNAKVDPIVSEQIDLAAREADRLERMLSELLDYSKPIDLKGNNLSALGIARKSIDSVNEAASITGVDLGHNLESSGDFGFYADEDMLIRLLTNLLLNAIQASDKGDAVELSMEKTTDGTVQIKVVDHGSGMNPKVRERLFEPFFTTNEDGTGLGMANVKKIVDAHGGSMVITSEENKGTTVRIDLPGGE